MLNFVKQQQSSPSSHPRSASASVSRPTPSMACSPATTTTTTTPASAATSSSASAHQKRAHTWIEGWAVLAHRNKMVSADSAEAWASVMRSVARTTSVSPTMMMPTFSSSQEQRLGNSAGFETISSVADNEGCQHLGHAHYDLEAEQVVATHRAAEAAATRLQKDQIGLRSVVARATEALDLGEGLAGPSVLRLRHAAVMIHMTLQSLRDEELSLGDVVADAERAIASVTKKMINNNIIKNRSEHHPFFSSHHASSSSSSLSARHMDPASGITTSTNNNNNNNNYSASAAENVAGIISGAASMMTTSMVTSEEKLRRFLARVGGRAFGWPKQDHDIFMHILFSGGFEDPSHTHATPNLGLRLGECQNYEIHRMPSSSPAPHPQPSNSLFSLADDDVWVLGRVIERLTPMLPHRLPDDIKRHFCLQRELEFLESQRRLEVRSWRDQREADATFDLGIAAALARTEQEEEAKAHKETELERRQRQEHLHLLVDRWKYKKDVAEATAAAAMAMTRRAVEEAKISRRAAIQAASTERTQQLLERRRMQKGAALWSTCAKSLGVTCASSPPSSSVGGSVGHWDNIAHQFGSGLPKDELSAALRERRKAALEQARQKRQHALEMEKKKSERDERIKMQAEVARAVEVAAGATGRSASTAHPKFFGGGSSSSRIAVRDPNRLYAATESSQNRQAACSDAVRGGETDANLKGRMLSRDGKQPYLTPRTMTSHRKRLI